MSTHTPSAYTRRIFLRRGVTLASALATAPHFVQRSALALAQMQTHVSSVPGVPDERVLVVVQLAGGNDGLNTVVPYADPAYHRARPGIGVREGDALRLDQGVGLHPALDGFKSLYDDGLLSVVQGVGYPNPNRSHFLSMDIWETGDTSGRGAGWLGRYFDNECAGAPEGECSPVASVAIGRTGPRTLQGIQTMPVSFDNPGLFRWSGDTDAALAQAHDAVSRAGDAGAPDPESPAAFLMRTALDANVASDQISAAVLRANTANYPRSPLAQQLAMVGAMIRAELRTKVYYVSLGGFDTHAGQGGANGRHANLLGQLGAALRAFYNDLRETRNHERVLTMVFSEFGRRVGQNASGGTDHGAAAPVFLAGPMVRAGLVGKHPSLTDLQDGDVKHAIDFRSVYASILDQWLRADSRAVLGARFNPAPALKRGL